MHSVELKILCNTSVLRLNWQTMSRDILGIKGMYSLFFFETSNTIVKENKCKLNVNKAKQLLQPHLRLNSLIGTTQKMASKNITLMVMY